MIDLIFLYLIISFLIALSLSTGDCSTTYYHYHDFWSIMPGNRNKTEPVYTNSDYIHHFNPKAKIILSVRHPIDRYKPIYRLIYANLGEFSGSVVGCLTRASLASLRCDIK